jgi:proteasome lid subunit RPN8/RPN11
MAILWLTDEQAQAIIAHVQRQSPDPVCGLIAGRGSQALAVIPSDDGPHLPPQQADLLAVQGLDRLAWYHTHPPGTPVPTLAEHHKSQWPDGVRVLVELTTHRAQLAAWDYQPGRVTPVELHIGSQPPLPPLDSGSHAQTVAILTSALLAFTLLIVLSIYLLPPAPPIP